MFKGVPSETWLGEDQTSTARGTARWRIQTPSRGQGLDPTIRWLAGVNLEIKAFPFRNRGSLPLSAVNAVSTSKHESNTTLHRMRQDGVLRDMSSFSLKP